MLITLGAAGRFSLSPKTLEGMLPFAVTPHYPLLKVFMEKTVVCPVA